MRLIPAPPALSPASVKCNSILTCDFAKVQLLSSMAANPQCPLLAATKPSLPSTSGAQSLPRYVQTASTHARNRQPLYPGAVRLQFSQGVGASVSYLVRLAKKRNPSSQYIQTCSKSLLNTGSPNPFLIHVKHHYHYRKHHPEAVGDPCPVPTSNTKSTPDMDYCKLLPHKVTKMTIWVSNGSTLPVQDSLCASHNVSSPSQLPAQQSMPGLCLADPRLS